MDIFALIAIKKKRKRRLYNVVIAQLQQLIPKVRGAPLVVNIERILQPATDFIRGNPIISTAIIGAGTSGLVTAIAVTRGARRSTTAKARRKKSKKTGRKRDARRTPRRKKKATHRSPRHRGHKQVTFTTKGGKKVRFLVKPKKHKHISHGRKKSKRFVKGSPEAKRFMAKLRRMKK